MIHNIIGVIAHVCIRWWAGIPTLYDLAQTGAMLGIFDQFLQPMARDWNSARVFVHGTLKLPLWIPAAAAGVILGKGYYFPGTLKRITPERSSQRWRENYGWPDPCICISRFFWRIVYPALQWSAGINHPDYHQFCVIFRIWCFIIYPSGWAKGLSLPQIERKPECLSFPLHNCFIHPEDAVLMPSCWWSFFFKCAIRTEDTITIKDQTGYTSEDDTDDMDDTGDQENDYFQQLSAADSLCAGWPEGSR